MGKLQITYRKREKICWAKLSQENFRGGLHLKHLNNTIIQSLSKIHRKTFAVLLKTVKNAKV